MKLLLPSIILTVLFVQLNLNAKPACDLDVYITRHEPATQALKRVIQKEEFVFIDFWAPWCGPCKRLKPIIEDISKKEFDQVNFIMIDSDKYPEIAQAYHVKGLPTCILFAQGKEVARFMGAKSSPQVKDFISKNCKA